MVQSSAWCATQTERHQADDERARLREQFHLSQRSEALGRLAGGIAHDFNNILGVILGLGDLSLIELTPDHPVRARIERILKAGQRAKDLIDQILAYSRQTLGERTVIDMGADLNGVLEILRATVPSTIDIVLSVAKSRCFVEAGRSQIEQVIMNLCVNAMHAIGQNQGRIDIWLETVDGREVAALEMSPAALRDNSDSGNVQPGQGRTNILWMSTPAPRDLIRLSIRDNGTGMDAATLAEIFQPFFTTKPSGTGTGLGLPAVHGIVIAYGGAIRVESEAGVGTQFDVFLPAGDGSVEPVEETEELVVTGNRRGRILVVDDEVDLAAVICAKLQNLAMTRWSAIIRTGPGPCSAATPTVSTCCSLTRPCPEWPAISWRKRCGSSARICLSSSVPAMAPVSAKRDCGRSVR